MASTPPSTVASPPGWLFGALPQMITPPQSPAARLPAGRLLVKTIGWLAVPSAMILPPRLMISVPLVSLSPLMMVPGWMVRVAPLSTYTKPFSSHTLSLVKV